MGVVRIKKPLLGEILGINDIDGPGGDESAVSTLNVRLDQMFREAIIRAPFVVLLNETELRKVADYNGWWRDLAKTLRSDPIKFDIKKDGLPDHVIEQVNAWPAQLAQSCGGFNGLVLAQAPQFAYTKKKNDVEMSVWMRIVLLPEEPSSDPSS